jgi:hypothetical protein
MHYPRGEGSKAHSKGDRVRKCITQGMSAQRRTRKEVRVRKHTTQEVRAERRIQREVRLENALLEG